ncbi:UNVERIFIED_CONTAM: hypothetical protein RMT77_016169 [Armadillidium vulgare]
MYCPLSYTFLFRFILIFITAQMATYRDVADGVDYDPKMSPEEMGAAVMKELTDQEGPVRGRSGADQESPVRGRSGADSKTKTKEEKEEKPKVSGMGKGKDKVKGFGGSDGTADKDTSKGSFNGRHIELLLLPVMMLEGTRLLRILF